MLKPHQDRDWLIQQYEVERRSAKSIGAECSVSDATIFRWLIKHGIETRNRVDKSYCRKLTCNSVELAKLYVSGMTIAQLADLYGVCAMTIHKFMVKHRISRRSVGGQFGKANRNWKGGRINNRGYEATLEKDHPLAGRNGYVPTHTLVMEQILGRPLEKTERVHHKNGVKNDNGVENLELFATERDHQLHEAKLNLFIKRLMFGELDSSLRPQLLVLFKRFSQGIK